MTNEEKYGTKDGLREILIDALTYSRGCDFCEKYGFVKSPCRYCTTAVSCYEEYEMIVDEWLQEECDADTR